MADWAATQMPRMRRETIAALQYMVDLGAEQGYTPDLAGLPGILASAELTWVTRDMTAAAWDASQDIPEWTPAAVIPSPTGLLLWQSDLPALPANALDPDILVPVCGVAWEWRDGRVRIVAMGRMRGEIAQTPQARRWSQDMRGRVPLVPVCEVVDHGGPLPVAEGVSLGFGGGLCDGLIAMLGTTWILSQMPTMAEPRAVTGAAGSGRWTRQERAVSVIDLRRMESRPAERGPDHPGREYTHRWVVRGHWRQQAVGPGRSQRRPTWVPSHLKGPEGAPLLQTERVMVWRR